MKTASLARRAVAIVLGVELLCALGFSCTALWHERRTRLRAFDVMLQGRSDSLLGAVQDAEDPEDNVTIDPAELKVPAEDVYAVYNHGGRLLGASKNAPVQLIERHGNGVRPARLNGESYRILQRDALRIIDRAENGGVGLRRPVTILYASPTRRMWHEIAEAAEFYTLVSLGLMCVTSVVLIVLMRRLLSPIAELASAASTVQPGQLVFDPPATSMRVRELRPLADALSTTIARLRKAFEAEHRFVGDAAHELKTAVAVVKSTVQVLAMRPRSQEEYREGIDRILDDNERVETLVSRMLTLARFEEQQPPAEPANLVPSVRHTLDCLAGFAEAHGVALQASLAPEVNVRLNPEAAEVLVSNLVVNAVQHSPRGAVVSVVLEQRDGAGRAAVLEVRDSGPGVAAGSLPHVFERFYRDDRSRSRQTGGAGLGLAICKSIVEQANGSIEMHSVQGQGTTVRAFFSLA